MNQDAVVKRIRSGWALHHDIEKDRFELRRDAASLTIQPKVGKPTILYLDDLLDRRQIDEKNFVYVIKK
jgi:hypothetical protein